MLPEEKTQQHKNKRNRVVKRRVADYHKVNITARRSALGQKRDATLQGNDLFLKDGQRYFSIAVHEVFKPFLDW